MQFNCRVDAAHFDDEENIWRSEVNGAADVLPLADHGRRPAVDPDHAAGWTAVTTFKGDSFHTFYWPHEGYDLTGKKVGIIGTGATAIQVIGDIADKVGSLHVFQRRANWAAPLNNSKISKSKWRRSARRYRRDLRGLLPHPWWLRA